MKRVLVLGSGGAGKSTFSRRLGDALQIPVIHLDRHYWRPNWVETPKDEWIRIVGDLISGDTWVMDGNYGGTLEMRIGACDTVILLDIPRDVCLYRILKRAFLHRGQTRPDMAEGCVEKIDLEFILWVWNYPKRSRCSVLAQLKHFPGKSLIVLRSTDEANAFLQGL